VNHLDTRPAVSYILRYALWVRHCKQRSVIGFLERAVCRINSAGVHEE
jgi:hypothetical protein